MKKNLKKITYFSLAFFLLLFIIYSFFYFSPTQWVYPKKPIYKEVKINLEEDRNKIGTVFSRLFKGQAFHQYPKTSGISENVIKLMFDHDVEIIGFLVSLDHSQKSLTIVEVAATINTKWGYDLSSKESAIIHTSFYASMFFGGTRKTDEKVFFEPGYGIQLKKTDYIAIGAVVENQDMFRKRYVSPEFIVYYRWLKK